MSTWFAQLQIFSFNNGGSGTKSLPSMFSFGKILKAKGFLPISSFGVGVFAVIVGICGFLQRTSKGFYAQASGRNA